MSDDSGRAPTDGQPMVDQPAPSSPAEPRRSYDEVTDPRYAEKAASFTLTQIPGGFVLNGPCPRCEDPMEYPHVDEVYRNIRRRSGRPAPGSHSTKLPMICTCSDEHTGQPPGAYGCGAYWNLTLEASE